MMERVLGPIPANVLLRGWTSSAQKGLLAMGPGGTVTLAPCRPEGNTQIETVRPLHEWILDPILLDLTRRLLEYDAFKRITAHDALRHPFFQASLHKNYQPQQQAQHSHYNSNNNNNHNNNKKDAKEQNPFAATSPPRGRKLSKMRVAVFLCALAVFVLASWVGYIWLQRGTLQQVQKHSDSEYYTTGQKYSGMGVSSERRP
jgi:serine/threonine protein kinase